MSFFCLNDSFAMKMGFFRSEPIAFYKNKARRIAALRVCLGAGSVATILSFGHMCTGLGKERSKQGDSFEYLSSHETSRCTSER
jgi:hypothetical protein